MAGSTLGILYTFFGYGIPYIQINRTFFHPRAMWAKVGALFKFNGSLAEGICPGLLPRTPLSAATSPTQSAVAFG